MQHIKSMPNNCLQTPLNINKIATQTYSYFRTACLSSHSLNETEIIEYSKQKSHRICIVQQIYFPLTDKRFFTESYSMVL